VTVRMLWDEVDIVRDAAKIERVAKQSIKLRPYQLASVDAAYQQWADHRSTLICLPTGTGKSVCFSEVMRRWDIENDGKILLVAHRKELIYQAVGHAKRAGLTAAIEMGARWARGDEDVVVSTVQTLNAAMKCKACFGEGCPSCNGVGKTKRMTRFDWRKFGLLTVDEGHHATANSYRSLMTYLNQNHRAKTLLVTATPGRADKVGLHNVCESVAYEMQLRQAVDDGWLVPIRQKFVTVDGLDLSQVKISKGDLAAGETERAFLGTEDESEERMLHSIAKPVIDEARGRPVIVFSAGQDHAKKLTAAFNAYDGVTAACVIDSTDIIEREQIIERYKSGEIQVLVNCMVFCEGFDAPATAVVANCRPTKSEALYLQMIGRGTRPLPGVVDGPETPEARKAAIEASSKSHCLVLDFVGTSGDIKLVSVMDVLAGESVDPLDLAEAMQVAVDAKVEFDPLEAIEKVKQARQEANQRKEAERRATLVTRTKADRADYSAVNVDIFGGERFDSYKKTEGAEPITRGQFGMLVGLLGLDKKTAKKLSKRKASKLIEVGLENARKVAVNDWTTLLKQAGSEQDLHGIGEAIAARLPSDRILNEDATIRELRQFYRERLKQMKEAGNG
jgi:superfamily II DNA or RNA helicase